MAVELRPMTQREALAYVREHHRHHGAPAGDLWRHAVHDDDGIVVGVAIVGRPVARGLDDGLTCEVTRLCTDTEPNAGSMLYKASEQAARAKGFRRGLTYLLASEWDRFDDLGRRTGGAAVRAVGWRELWRVKGRSWDTPSRPRTDKHPTEDKVAVGWGAWPPRKDAHAIKPASVGEGVVAEGQDMPTEPKGPARPTTYGAAGVYRAEYGDPAPTTTQGEG